MKKSRTSLVLSFADDNLIHKLTALKDAAAIASGVKDHVWTILELIEESVKLEEWD